MPPAAQTDWTFSASSNVMVADDDTWFTELDRTIATHDYAVVCLRGSDQPVRRKILGIGTVDLPLVCPSPLRTNTITLKKVLYVQDISYCIVAEIEDLRFFTWRPRTQEVGEACGSVIDTRLPNVGPDGNDTGRGQRVGSLVNAGPQKPKLWIDGQARDFCTMRGGGTITVIWDEDEQRDWASRHVPT